MMKKGECIQFSVLLPVYVKDNPDYLRRALESLINQTCMPTQIVIVEDGKLTEALYTVLDQFSTSYPCIKRVPISHNVQLGRALAIGVEHCEHEWIARMDSDDIAVSDRFALQLAFASQHPEIAAFGGAIAEFTTEDEVDRIKTMPITHAELYRYGKYRNPLNHMTVMFQKSEVLAVGNYRHLIGLEDYDLWSRLLAHGKKLANLSEVLVHARVDRDFAARRGGWKYFLRYVQLRYRQKKIGYTGILQMLIGIFLSAAVTLIPKGLRNRIYNRLRRNSKE